MWVLAVCDDEGKCTGFLKNDKSVSTNPDGEFDALMKFKTKKETNEICLQINLSKKLMSNGYPFRVTPVKC